MMVDYKLKSLFLKIALSAAFLSLTHPLYPQSDIEKATRQTDILGRPELMEEALRKIPEKPGPKEPVIEEAAPPKEEEKKFLVKKIDLAGCESFLPQEFSSIIEKYENKELSLSELNAAAKEIELSYLRRGVIAAVIVPAQEIKEGVVKLQVIEARLGKLEIEKHKYFKENRLKYYWKTPPGAIIHYDKVSQNIQMMNKNPDRHVKASLHAGKKPGTTNILLTPQTRFPLHLLSTYDREGENTTGKSKIGIGGRHNNFLGLDDTLLSGYNFGQEFSGFYVYHSLPLNAHGTSLLYGFSRSDATPKKEFAAILLKSTAKNTSISLHQDLYKKDEYLGEVYFGLEAKDKTVKRDTGISNRDRLRIFNLGGSLLSRGLGTTTFISSELSQGVDILGASSKLNPLASRQAKSDFSKINLNIQHNKALPLNLQANLKVQAQASSTKLTPQEELGLGGMDSVRGYPASDYLADNAALTSAELLIPAAFLPQWLSFPYSKTPLKQDTTSLLFLDYGWGDRRSPAPTDKKNIQLVSLGGGIRIKAFDQALLRLEWGFPLIDNSITEEGQSRFHFSVDLQEKLPEEIERIKKIMEEEYIRRSARQLVNEEFLRPGNPIRKKLYQYLYLARACYKQGKLQATKELYEKISKINASLYQQSEDYVRAVLSREKELKGYHVLALAHYKEGKFNEAKQIWQKIIDEAEIKPLLLEF